MRLGREVDDRVDALGQLQHEVAVLDRADDQLHVVGQVLAPPGVGELVEHHHVVLVLDEAHVGRADEAGRAGHEQPHTRTPGRRRDRPARSGRAVAALAAEHRVGRPGRGPRELGGRARLDAAVRRPARSKISRANSNHEHEPDAAEVVHAVVLARREPTSASARWPVKVGEPTWSSTTRSSSRSAEPRASSRRSSRRRGRTATRCAR